ncbi:MAG TPA: GlsB/YeaQ/YmgE family stress response membrane protein [Candidatus Dormibacteraeota bacterium]|nr:GlsB/YeaQ/YmgE family stress response membrane protein [Candidatus Dormibacteraeota bacterium]
MNILVWIIVGAIAGFVAGKVVTGRGMGLLWDIVVGIVGAFLGGWLASLAGIGVSTGTFTIGGILAAIVGAIILLAAFKLLTGRGTLRHA